MPIVNGSTPLVSAGVQRLADSCDDQGGEIVMPDESRIAMLKEVLAANPDDAFARYALGLEYSGAGDTEAALAEFQRLLASHPDYTNGYFMAAQTLARADRNDEARALLQQGIESARRTCNQHALAEMEGMLDELDRG
jgi:thioredoxin-like negative regulator of GroEL